MVSGKQVHCDPDTFVSSDQVFQCQKKLLTLHFFVRQPNALFCVFWLRDVRAQVLEDYLAEQPFAGDPEIPPSPRTDMVRAANAQLPST